MKIIVAVALLSLADPALAAAPSTTCDVRDFGAVGDGRTVDTMALQRAIDACAARGGGTVELPPGRFVSGTLRLASHITLQLDGGAVLAGSTAMADYLPGSAVGLGTTLGVDVAGEGTMAGLLTARDVTDVTIAGPGVIDGSGLSFFTRQPHVVDDFDPAATRNPAGSLAALHDPAFGPIELRDSGRPGVLVLFLRATNVTIRDVTLRESPNWTLVLQTVRRAVVTGLHIDNSPLIPNNDGIDCNDCADVHIAGGDIHAGDDDIAISLSHDVTVADLSLSSRSAAIRLESSQRVVFSHLTIDSNRGLAVFASALNDRPTDGVIFADIVLRTHLIPGHWWGKAEPIYIAVQPCAARRTCASGVRNVTFANIDADAEAGAVIAGAPDLPITGLTLSNVRLRMVAPDAAVAAAVGGNFDRRWTAPTRAEGIVRHDIPAIACSDVTRTTFRDVEVDWPGPMPIYATAALACEHFADLVVDNLVERGSPPPRASSIAVGAGTGLRIERHHPAPGRPAVTGAGE